MSSPYPPPPRGGGCRPEGGAVAILRQVPLFSCLTDDELESLSLKVVVRRYPENAVIISEGDERHSECIIDKGRRSINRALPPGW